MSHFLPSSAQVRSTEEKPNATMKVLRSIKGVPIGLRCSEVKVEPKF